MKYKPPELILTTGKSDHPADAGISNEAKEALRELTRILAGSAARRDYAAEVLAKIAVKKQDGIVVNKEQRRILIAEYRVNRPLAEPAHPGELMREILDDRIKLSVAVAATRMGIPRRGLSKILDGTSPVTAEIALMFGRLVGGEPDLYMNMQINYEMWHGRKRLADRLQKIKPAQET
jgi:antitoxin HigA-1